MHVGLSRITVGCLLLMMAFLHACDFRQMIEDRPVALPEESTEPKEQHSAETRPSPNPSIKTPIR
jgi:hypothetical protein